MDTARVAAALAELLRSPRWREITEQSRSTRPPGLADQLDAASIEAWRLHQVVMATERGDGYPTPTPASIPEFLFLPILHTLVQFGVGRAETCMHSPTIARPEPLFAAAWRPGLVACRECAHLLALPRNSDRDRTCDRCGRVCASGDDAEAIRPGRIAYGPLIYGFGVCPGRVDDTFGDRWFTVEDGGRS